jgi:hypothetical protein
MKNLIAIMLLAGVASFTSCSSKTEAAEDATEEVEVVVEEPAMEAAEVVVDTTAAAVVAE